MGLFLLLISCSSTPESMTLLFSSRMALQAELTTAEGRIQTTQSGWKYQPSTTGNVTLNLDVPNCPVQSIDLKVGTGKKTREEKLELDCEVMVGEAAFRLIPPGRFDMGSALSEDGRQEDERQVSVELTEGYWMASTETTQSFFLNVAGESPSLRGFNECAMVGNAAEPSGQQPVYCVDWYEALEFANALSKKEGFEPCYQILTKTAVWKEGCRGYRLPTEAEWEYAAVANESFVYSGGDKPDDVGWHKTNSLGKTHIVGQKKPNGFGLYDMSGNVSEWVWDRYKRHREGSKLNPDGPREGSYRILRGGNWSKPIKNMRHADRVDFVPFYRLDVAGFRLVRSFSPSN